MTEAFRPAWWARSGFAQTVASVLARPRDRTPLRTEVWDTPDGDFLRLHFVDAPPGAPTVLLLHGLEGSRESVYAVETARLCVQRGLRLAILEFRSCGGVLNRARRTYHSGETTDVDFVVRRLAQGGSELFAVGFSLGGNVLLKWLGEQGDGVPACFVAAAAVSTPFDLEMAARRCDSRWGGVMARHFLRTLIPKAIAKAEQHPGVVDLAAVRRCRTFAAFDDLVTAPLHGFRDARHYWTDASCARFLPAIRRRTLLLASRDDPLIPAAALPVAAASSSPCLVAEFLPRGGHVGFVAGGSPWRPRRWAERACSTSSRRADGYCAGTPRCARARPITLFAVTVPRISVPPAMTSACGRSPCTR